MSLSVSALSVLVPVRSQDGTARGLVLALVLDDRQPGLGLVIHDLELNCLRSVDAAEWTVDRFPGPQGIVLPAHGAATRYAPNGVPAPGRGA